MGYKRCLERFASVTFKAALLGAVILTSSPASAQERPLTVFSQGGGQTVTINGVSVSRDVAFRVLPVALPLRSARISSLYGMRGNPFGGNGVEFHPGVDFAAPKGEAVFSTAAGIVVFAGRSGDYGEMVELRHVLGFRTRYAHLDSINVNVGETVDRNTVLGRVGTTGRSTGYHLYLEIWHGDDRIDPISFMIKAYELYRKLD